jgi:hypothetical protein
VRSLLVASVVALAGCSIGVRPSTESAGGVTVGIDRVTDGGATRLVPYLTGLGDGDANALANAELARAGTVPIGENDTSDLLDVSIEAVDPRYVTVMLSPLYGDADQRFVFSREGERLSFRSFVKDRRGVDAIAAYAARTLPDVLGADAVPANVAARVAKALAGEVEFVPLPEGLEVTLANAGEADFGPFSPVLVVPWDVLAPYLALPPSGGDRKPPYRNGRRLAGWELDALRDTARGTVERAMSSQLYDAEQRWVLATVDGEVVSFIAHGTTYEHRRNLAETCASMPESVRVSLALACS